MSQRNRPIIGLLRGRVQRTATVLLGVGLLGVSVVSTVQAGRSAARDNLDHALTSQASSQAAALDEYFDRARSVLLLLAHDSSLTRFADPEGELAQGVTSAARAHAAGAAMAYLETLYPGRISEACLIDSTGTELARVVRGEVAPSAELAMDEAGEPFFGPTMALAPGRVYQAAPYLSSDTDEWVVSNSTPMVTPGGRVWGMVHFEVAMDSFRPAPGAEHQGEAAIVDTRTGRVLLESGRPTAGGDLGRAGAPDLQSLATRDAEFSSGTLRGRRVAVAQVAAQPDNANSWAVLVTAPPRAQAWSRSIGPAPVATALSALLLLVLAALNLRARHRELRTASLTDELTGLPNRRLLADRVDQALLLDQRKGTASAVLLIDLDRFKEINDTLGHQQGDRLLRAVAERLSHSFRSCDTVARLGGDEFAVLLPEVPDADAALLLTRRCLDALHEPFFVDGLALNVEASIGLALAPQHGRDGNALLRAADVAMYEAKERKSGAVVYDPDLDVNTPTRLALLGDLRRALQDGELLLHYQPKLELGSAQVHSVEALVRWQHPTRGLVPPADFIPIAEGTGLILPITLRTLELAITQARQWLHDGQPLQVAVNLSPRCLLELTFPATVQAMLCERGLPAQLLRLEITEGTLMADPARALAVLSELQGSGVALSIDDFGTGYSSMSYLKRLPVDELKIDRSFITDMLTDRSDAVLVRSSIDLGHNLGLRVVAEGVEDQATQEELLLLGCDVVQGFHLGRPMTAAALEGWLEARRALPAPAAAGR